MYGASARLASKNRLCSGIQLQISSRTAYTGHRKRVRHATLAFTGLVPTIVSEVLRRADGQVILHGTALVSAVGGNAALLYGAVVAAFASVAATGYRLAHCVWLFKQKQKFSQLAAATEEPLVLYNVDVSGSKCFTQDRVQQAARFADAAHEGQMRKTGEPYITHPLETALIVEQLMAMLPVPPEPCRVEDAVVAALLHDVTDDAKVDISVVAGTFGSKVASMVTGISKLSRNHQLMRRICRNNESQLNDEAKVGFILRAVEDPDVLLVKMADRLHNMRTIHALAVDRARDVSVETLSIWCTVAGKLGLSALKGELEDLSFAVLKPDEYEMVRDGMDEIWSRPSSVTRARKQQLVEDVSIKLQERIEQGALETGPPVCHPQYISTKKLPGYADAGARTSRDPDFVMCMACDVSEQECSATDTECSTSVDWGCSDADAEPSAVLSHQEMQLRFPEHSVLAHQPLTAGIASALFTPNSRRNGGTGNRRSLSAEQLRMKCLVKTVPPFHRTMFTSLLTVPEGAPIQLLTMKSFAHELLREIHMESHVPGLQIDFSGRLKSVYSTYRKMQRKNVPLEHVFDARALRVIVNDDGQTKLSDAIRGCFDILPTVHRLWRPIRGEFDDYITDRKPSGYQSLHTAVKASDGMPLEVQIRTSTMHTDAEYGDAAHWMYKKAPTAAGSVASGNGSDRGVHVGQPVRRVSNSKLQDGVIVAIESSSSRSPAVVAAVRTGGFLPGSGPSSFASLEEYSHLLDYVTEKGYVEPGHGDWSVKLERYVLMSDGKYHFVDHLSHKHAAYITPLQPHLFAAKSENDQQPSIGQLGMGDSVPSVSLDHSTADTAHSAAQHSRDLKMEHDVDRDASAGSSQAAFFEQDHNGVIWCRTSHAERAERSTSSVPSTIAAAVSTSVAVLHTKSHACVETTSSSSTSSSTLDHSAVTSLVTDAHRVSSQLLLQAPATAAATMAAGMTEHGGTGGTVTTTVLQHHDDVELSESVSSAAVSTDASVKPDLEVSAAEHVQHRVRELRARLERGELSVCDSDPEDSTPSSAHDVMVFLYPSGKFERVPFGTTAGDIANDKGVFEIADESVSAAVGAATKLVNVNNKLVPESTLLRNGDTVILTRCLLDRL